MFKYKICLHGVTAVGVEMGYCTHLGSESTDG